MTAVHILRADKESDTLWKHENGWDILSSMAQSLWDQEWLSAD